ncbi:hypothetical protein EVAR_23149_1 [Eumeta japonica]|uniref:Uncharacterized protein n=1 Tax=Eumeta variegata TaxID=151549 RepID=A0A4C1VBJ7_EUMVA|nr:hypothetical protein EVAR_23149_1 [Eumeta japonica]
MSAFWGSHWTRGTWLTSEKFHVILRCHSRSQIVHIGIIALTGDQSEAKHRGGRYGRTANWLSDRMWHSCVKNAKCMAIPPRLKYMQLKVQADTPSINFSEIGASVTIVLRPPHMKLVL